MIRYLAALCDWFDRIWNGYHFSAGMVALVSHPFLCLLLGSDSALVEGRTFRRSFRSLLRCGNDSSNNPL